MNLPVSTLSGLLSGQTNPTRTTLAKISSKLNWSPELLRKLELAANDAKNAKAAEQKIRRQISPVEGLLKTQLPLALFALARTGLLNADVEILSAALSAPAFEIEASLQLLKNLDMIKINGGLLEAIEPNSAIVEDPQGPQIAHYMNQWLTNAASRMLTEDPLKVNSITFPIVTTKEQLENLKPKFEAFANSVQRSFPIQGASGELFYVAAIVVPYLEANANHLSLSHCDTIHR